MAEAVEPQEPQIDGEGYYLISNAAELVWFEQHVNAGNDTANAKLTHDIDLSENGTPMEWRPIGDYVILEVPSFEGVFDGNGHTISGYKITKTGLISDSRIYLGFFGWVSSQGTVKNLTLDGDISADMQFESETQVNVGGVVAILDGGTLENCTNSGDITVFTNVSGLRRGDEAEVTVGGILASFASGGSDTLRNCVNTGNISSVCSPEYTVNSVGGIAGDYTVGRGIFNCVNKGTVQGNGAGSNFVGGIVGSSNKSGVISDCTNEEGATVLSAIEGSYYGVRLYIGGIIGYTNSNAECEISNCTNKADIKPSSKNEDRTYICAGGIGGSLRVADVINSSNNGEIVCDEIGNSDYVYIGGIAGENSYWSGYGAPYSELNGCVNSGNVTISASTSASFAYVGGISGYCDGGALLGCVNNGTVLNNAAGDNSFAGGLVGVCKNRESTGVENCAWATGTADSAIGNNLKDTIIPPESTASETINNQAVTKLGFESSEFALKNGASATMKIQTLPAESANFANHAKITGVTVDPAGIATATDNGDGTISVTANSLGTATVTVNVNLFKMDYSTMTVDASQTTPLTLTATINVSDRSSESMKLSSESLSLKVGDEGTLTASLLPEGTADSITSVTWSSSDENVAMVTGGDGNACTVKALAVGGATVTAEAVTADGYTYTATCAVNVSAAPVPEPTPEPSHGGGGGGCNYGWGTLALLALAPLTLRRKK